MRQLTDEEKLQAIAMLRESLEVYCASALKVLPKEGGLPVPFIWNRAQRYIHARLEEQRARLGYIRALVLKGRQQGCCYSPDMRVLTADYHWVRIGDLELGARIMAVDEEASGATASGRKTERRVRMATVEAKVTFEHETFEVELDNGTTLVVTGEHRHLCQQRGGCVPLWRTVSSMKVGDQIRAFAHAPLAEPTLDDAWFGGLLDGEGSFGAYPAVRISLTQVDGPVLRRAKAYLESRNIRYYELVDRRTSGVKSKLGDKPVHCLRIDRHSDIVKLLTLTRPTRFTERELFADKKLPKSAPGFDAWPTVVAIRPAGKRQVVDIQTSAKTFICEGLVSHNSTYVGARYYHRTSMNPGENAFIVAHEEKATTSLFKMVKRYHDHNALAPSTKASNAQELLFGRLDSGYKLATAGSDDVGRGNTARLLHGSEFGFWKNAQTHLAGLGNTIPSGAKAAGSEIILESTGNGMGNAFHLMWQEAEAGVGEYIAIFVPWYWQEEYTTAASDGLELSESDKKYQAAYDLTDGQMQWRANKITEYGKGFEWLFDQEYPATAALAFQTSTQNPLINPSDVSQAVNNRGWSEMQGPFVIGCDPAEEGADRTAIVFRTGRTVWRCEYQEKSRLMGVAGILAGYWTKGVEFRGQQVFPDAIFVDRIGIGAGVVDRLRELNIPVIGVHSGERANESDIYENKRAEMWWNMKEWLEDHPNRLPNDAALISDLIAPQPAVTSKSKKLLESKKDMKKRGIRSPDGGDALALTFAEPVLPRIHTQHEGRGGYRSPTKAGY